MAPTSPPDRVQTLRHLLSSRDAPEIDGSEGAFIALIIILLLVVILCSITAVFFLLRKPEPSAADRARRQRALDASRSASASGSGGLSGLASRAKGLFRSVSAGSRSMVGRRTTNGSANSRNRRVRGWIQASSGGEWEEEDDAWDDVAADFEAFDPAHVHDQAAAALPRAPYRGHRLSGSTFADDDHVAKSLYGMYSLAKDEDEEREREDKESPNEEEVYREPKSMRLSAVPSHVRLEIKNIVTTPPGSLELHSASGHGSIADGERDGDAGAEGGDRGVTESPTSANDPNSPASVFTFASGTKFKEDI